MGNGAVWSVRQAVLPKAAGATVSSWPRRCLVERQVYGKRSVNCRLQVSCGLANGSGQNSSAAISRSCS